MTRQSPMAIASAVAMLLIGTIPDSGSAQTHPNILMIIADDVGVDMIGAYQQYEGSTDVPPTPAIDSLATAGIQFVNTWSNPMCATTRATIQTGRYSYRTGVRFGTGVLLDEEFSIAEILSADAALHYTTATFGKWGLADRKDGTHAVLTGYDFFAGDPWAGINNYFEWTKYTAQLDETAPNPPCDLNDPAWHDNLACIAAWTDSISNYATTENVDDTLWWIDSVEDQDSDQPWFLILSFNAAHKAGTHFQVPPDHLHSYGTVVEVDGEEKRMIGPYEAGDACDDEYDPICYRAMIQAMDSEIQRLLDNLPPGDTTIVFLGDNGSVDGMARDPFDPDRAKASLYEGGINIPLIVTGAGVSGTPRVSKALVNTSDLFLTVLELTGVDASALPTNLPDTDHDRYNGQAWEHDSFSLMPILSDSVANIREYAYADILGSHTAIRNRDGYKLIVSFHPLYASWEFYDLETDPFEHTNLIAPFVDPETGVETPLVHPKTGKLIERGLLDAEAEAAYFDLSKKLEPWEDPKLPGANLDADADAVVNDEDNCSAFANQDQLDTNLDGYGNACDADYDNDGDVDDDDLAVFQDAFGKQGVYNPDVDCDGDGRITLSDFVCFKTLEGLPPGPSGLACAGVIPCIADNDGDGVRNLDDNCGAVANQDQLDTNLDGYGNACDADYDNDGDVDDDDLAVFQDAFGKQGVYNPDVDCDGDGRITLSDFVCFKTLEGLPPGPSGLLCVGTVPCVASQ